MLVRANAFLNPQKIMVRATNWIGDAVLSLPALEALRERFPEAEIILVAQPWVGELYLHHPALDRLIVYDPEGEHLGKAGFRKLLETLRREEFDGAILFPNSFHAAWMAWRAEVPVRIGYARDGRGWLLTEAIAPPAPAHYGHQVYYYLELLFRAGLIEAPEPVSQIRLRLAKAERQRAARTFEEIGLAGPRRLVGLNPGAAFGPAKRWLPEGYAALADRLVAGLHADVLIFGSQAERALAEEVAGEMKHTPVLVAGTTSLREWMGLVSHCRLVVTNDSGPMHVAAALGVPVLAVFGSTEERATGPVSRRARIVKHPVACSPCGLRECPIDFRCMTGVTVDEVYRAALELVAATEEG